jgi:oligopeptide/dipeptide ABC transporter ATP-binding protein
MAILLITHDLAVVAEVAERVAVMYAGQVVECSDTESLFADPLHPYTKGLMRSIPRLDEERDRLEIIEGAVPDFRQLPSGCRFHPRCPLATDQCREASPPLEELRTGHRVACWRADA